MRHITHEKETEVEFDVDPHGRINLNRDPPGQKSVYIPSGDINRETYRLTTFRNYPRDSPIDPRDFALNGFYYTGYKDRVKCFSCGQSIDNWLLGDDVTSSRWQTDQSNLVGLFPCLTPINPHMRSREMRIQTFLDHSSIWPAYWIRATPADIADAEMHYLGERDRVKCWYCNWGLQNWERDDSPWEEHAKWFPLCEFVLQRKGPQFVHRIATEHPGLRRPMLYNPSTSSSAREIAVIINQSQSNHHEFRNESQTSHLVVVDPQDEMRKRRKKIDQIMTSSLLISDARLMGFDDDIIRMAVTRQYKECGIMFSCMVDLVDALLKLEKINNKTNPICIVVSPVSDMIINQSRDDLQCRICKNNMVSIVFYPCAHVVCCILCGWKREKCPVCNDVVQDRRCCYLYV